MRILHLLKSDKFSGAENVVLTIMNLFLEEEMIYASPDGPIRKVVEEAGHRFYALESSKMGSVKKAITELKPDVIHAHDFNMATNAAWAAGKTPVIAHLHNNPPWLGKIHPKSMMFALALPRIQQVISVSESVQKEYLFGWLMNGKNTVLGNFVDVERVRRMAQEPCTCGDVDLVFLGRLSAPKRPLLFCEIVKQVKEKIPGVTARMIGDGELAGEVRSYLSENDLQDTIELVGFQSNPYTYLKCGKIMVMPSAWEGFGLAAVEALSLGLPVLCSGVGGLKNIVNESCGGICSEKSQYEESIFKLLNGEVDWDQIKKNCCVRANVFSDKQSYKEILKKVYSGALT
ncbi:glycosyltransferase [Allofournierella sp. CML151]|uniref:glycosyltransferase n=1 Tax=Allofournierella sp. CML151 TaxID=2998082 RepID=UPI0022EB88C8|nr:glycosyltransferase [Fournierella sp. CML151]